ncbi:alpha/beta hydrolase family protein [Tenacibaculum maritimum]|uniref:alpha/beta hydrolase family protein n=1 Tax=Tenacibaculum maritimum TaxID=107401 RepID=UPI003875B150
MQISKNNVLQSQHHKPILLDLFFKKNNTQKPIIIFCHGYKGFKDWGAWDLMASYFANAGFFFIKFNFSHNGGTIEHPMDFPDLNSFGENNYTKELDDLKTVIDWISSENDYSKEKNTMDISLIGHSRGGGIISIKAAEDKRVQKLITLAGVSDYKSRFPKGEKLLQWKAENVFYVKNGRTHQKMPHFYQFYKNFIHNESRLTIQRAVSSLKIPHLIIHGSNNVTVTIEEAQKQHFWNPNSQFIIIKGGNHVFGASHPWTLEELPTDLEKALLACLDFLKT